MDANRYEDLHLVDARVQKTLPIGSLSPTFTFDVFNLFNTGVRLREISQVGTTFRNPTELVPPRLIRLGLQVRF